LSHYEVKIVEVGDEHTSTTLNLDKASSRDNSWAVKLKHLNQFGNELAQEIAKV